MLPRFRFARTLALAVAVLLAAAGCSQLPTSPTASAPSEPVASGSSSEILGLFEGSSSTTTTTMTLGTLGGVVRAGDFTLTVPPLALTRTATITVSQPDPARPVVELSIAPASANRFLVPVLLTANADKMERSLLSVACVSYYNPSTGQWEPVSESTVSLLTLTVSAPLSHFSTYRVESGGKAGW
jgi:hypothetical protein